MCLIDSGCKHCRSCCRRGARRTNDAGPLLAHYGAVAHATACLRVLVEIFSLRPGRLTLRLSRARKPERSGGWRASAAGGCSAGCATQGQDGLAPGPVASLSPGASPCLRTCDAPLQPQATRPSWVCSTSANELWVCCQSNLIAPVDLRVTA